MLYPECRVEQRWEALVGMHQQATNEGSTTSYTLNQRLAVYDGMSMSMSITQ
jgi:hypothetical protein